MSVLYKSNNTVSPNNVNGNIRATIDKLLYLEEIHCLEESDLGQQ